MGVFLLGLRRSVLRKILLHEARERIFLQRVDSRLSPVDSRPSVWSFGWRDWAFCLTLAFHFCVVGQARSLLKRRRAQRHRLIWQTTMPIPQKQQVRSLNEYFQRSVKEHMSVQSVGAMRQGRVSASLYPNLVLGWFSLAFRRAQLNQKETESESRTG
jgi:hypothetical protein